MSADFGQKKLNRRESTQGPVAKRSLRENQRRMTVCRRLLQSTLLAGAYKRNWYARARVVQWCNNGKQDTDDGEDQEEERTRCTIINHPGYKVTRSQALSREVTINTTTSFFSLQSYNNKKTLPKSSKNFQPALDKGQSSSACS